MQIDFPLKTAISATLLLFTQACPVLASAAVKHSTESVPLPQAPNVLMILTDDQGFSDLGFYGNPSLETPNLDALARSSVRLEDFVASPTCSPTRAALMTGQHEFKVGITHTISGRSLLKPGVPTLPQHFKNAGYATAIFGKWHLGDTYPSRPQDRGFDETFIHLGGGIGQTPDYWGNTYFNPEIQHNGTWVSTDAYCTKVFSDAAWDWIQARHKQPWLAYLAYNAPHTPLQIDDALAQKYLDKGLPESQARFYAMIDDLDREVGELLQKLDATGLADNTIVIFMGDNGSAKGGKPAEMEYNAGLRGTKASPYQGGVRVPCFIRWPAGGIEGGRPVDQLTGIIDLFPTLAELASIPLPDSTIVDGRSLQPLLQNESANNWPDRSIVTHVGRWANETPLEESKYAGSAIRNERFSLVAGTELYDLENDRAQENDVSKDYPEVFATLQKQYDQWWHSLESELATVPPIIVGSPQQPIADLTCMDWGASRLKDSHGYYPPWHQGYIRSILSAEPLNHITPVGAWQLQFLRSGKYRITLRNLPPEAPASEARILANQASLQVGAQTLTQPIPAGQRAVHFELPIEAGITTLESLFEYTAQQRPAHGAFYVSVEYLDSL
ncbi:arylsulfatase [Coraliomargarita sp. SDUM461004]|uniref:Arylsulfatase n=1 Tax=Thalassobacterium sedimentorum TaxID=3041258 RepID=A0ABU1ANK3_9BACT|nr:arylsulfatase [Coraliomargarita sp. SDUM461004]MDQ8196264.1 arylsulfatase [Coraliomargarita sp. SDUM461004]